MYILADGLTWPRSLKLLSMYIHDLDACSLPILRRGRPIIARHRAFAFYRPSAVSIARLVVDIPLNAFQAIIFSLIFYFMAGFQRTASQFFIYLLFVLLSTCEEFVISPVTTN